MTTLDFEISDRLIFSPDQILVIGVTLTVLIIIALGSAWVVSGIFISTFLTQSAVDQYPIEKNYFVDRDRERSKSVQEVCDTVEQGLEDPDPVEESKDETTDDPPVPSICDDFPSIALFTGSGK